MHSQGVELCQRSYRAQGRPIGRRPFLLAMTRCLSTEMPGSEFPRKCLRTALAGPIDPSVRAVPDVKWEGLLAYREERPACRTRLYLI